MTGTSRKTLWLSRGLLLLACLLVNSTAWGQQIHRNGFESRDTAWVKAQADAVFKETAHKLTDDFAHSGQHSEFIQIQAEQGTYIHYAYDLGRAPLSEELSITFWLKANRPGAQIMARVVLPHERDKEHIDVPLATLLRGDSYQQVGRWQRLELRKAVKQTKDQQQLLRAELNRDVNLADAYIDRVMLNVYGGPGLTEIWIDDLEAGPVLDPTPFQKTARALDKPATPGPAIPRRAAIVELKDDRLLVGNKRFFFRTIRHTDTPLKALRDAGFNCVWFDGGANTALVDEAINLGFWVVPALPLSSDNGKLTSTDTITKEVARYLEQDGVLFWDIGFGGLTAEQVPVVTQAAQLVRSLDPQRPLAADVWDGFRPYGRTVNLLGVHRFPLMTGLELSQYRDWLNQRRLLAEPDATFTWTWVQTHLPDWFVNQVYERPATAPFTEPIGPQPEQIRLLTYIALSAGCNGLGFWSDRFLADSHQGRDRLLTLALLNQELQMLEPLLVATEQPGSAWIDTSVKDVKAYVRRTDRGVLVLPIWVGAGSQYVPGQAAAAGVTLVVPDMPTGAQAWEVTPGDVRAIKCGERVAGGTKITLPEFGLTTALVISNDSTSGLLVRFQEQNRQMRKVAAQWAHDLAEIELEKVLNIHEQLERAGHIPPDSANLIANARTRLQTCVTLWNNGEHREAYREAERVLRPLRILMRAEWELAVRELDTPVASPYAVSYFTLPRHWNFMQQVKQAQAGSNLLPDGNFELPADQATNTWLPTEVKLDDVDLVARRVVDDPKEGRQCLMLQITPKKPTAPPKALERTFLAMQSSSVRMTPGSLVRISGWLRIPSDITASADGAMLYDNCGGEPLAVRVSKATKWKQFTLYRRVPASGLVNVTLGLTGIGTVFFDDVRIEPLLAGPAPVVQK